MGPWNKANTVQREAQRRHSGEGHFVAADRIQNPDCGTGSRQKARRSRKHFIPTTWRAASFGEVAIGLCFSRLSGTSQAAIDRNARVSLPGEVPDIATTATSSQQHGLAMTICVFGVLAGPSWLTDFKGLAGGVGASDTDRRKQSR